MSYVKNSIIEKLLLSSYPKEAFIVIGDEFFKILVHPLGIDEVIEFCVVISEAECYLSFPFVIHQQLTHKNHRLITNLV